MRKWMLRCIANLRNMLTNRAAKPNQPNQVR
ncbi:hypothetical protein Knedl_CDS0023 [Pseudomonas phage Knedl]|nr:hypothetical protein Knedl_CDS0023 [Pseudomonas phage Knedl]